MKIGFILGVVTTLAVGAAVAEKPSASTGLKPSSFSGLKLTVLPEDFLPDSIRNIFFSPGGFSSLVD